MQLTRLHKQYAYVGDKFSDCSLALFADADYAGDKTDSISTSGVFVAVIGPRTYVPIKAISKKQTCSSHSTCESEVVAMNLGLKEALPLLDFWESIQLLFSPMKTGAGKSLGKPGAGNQPASAAGGAELVPRLTGRLSGSDLFETTSADSVPAELYLFEDNESTITVIEKGASAKLGHLTRTHRVNLHWMSEVVRSNSVHLGHIGTDD